MGRTEDLIEQGLWPLDRTHWIEPVRIARNGQDEIVQVLREEPSPDGATARSTRGSYRPMDHPELPGEFANLADGNADAILDFAQRFGHLGFSEAGRHGLELAPVPGQRDIAFQMPPGDPVPWIVNHATTLNVALRLAALLGRPKELTAYLRTLAVSEYVDGMTVDRDVIVIACAYRGWLEREPIIVPAAEILAKPKQEAVKIVSALLSSNLEGVSRVIEPDTGGTLSSSFRFRSLIDCIYWLAADAVAREGVRACAYCGRPFVVTHERMLYCPLPGGEKGVSPCMNRAKQRRFQQAKKEKAKRAKRGWRKPREKRDAAGS